MILLIVIGGLALLGIVLSKITSSVTSRMYNVDMHNGKSSTFYIHPYSTQDIDAMNCYKSTTFFQLNQLVVPLVILEIVSLRHCIL